MKEELLKDIKKELEKLHPLQEEIESISKDIVKIDETVTKVSKGVEDVEGRIEVIEDSIKQHDREQLGQRVDELSRTAYQVQEDMSALKSDMAKAEDGKNLKHILILVSIQRGTLISETG